MKQQNQSSAEHIAHGLVTVGVYAAPVFMVAFVLLLMVSPFPIFAVLPGLAILALLWFGRRDITPYLFYGIVALVPFGAYRNLGGDFSFVRIHWILAATLTLLVVLRILIRRRIPEELRRSRFWAAVLIFFLVNVLALLGSAVPGESVKFIMMLAVGYLLVALGMTVVDFKGFCATLPRVVVGSVFVSSLLALLGAAGISWFVSSESGRVLGGAPDPNNMSLMVIFSIPLAVYFLLTAQKPLTRLVLLMVIAVDVAAVIATFSRGGALILAVACLLMLWTFRHRISPRNLGLLLGAGGLAVALLVGLTPESYTHRIGSIRSSEDFSLNRRASYITVARDLVAQRPLLGYGPDCFAALYAKTEIGRRFKGQAEGGRRRAHNSYLEVLTGSGVFGLGAFLALLVVILRSFGRARRMFLAAGYEKTALLVVAYRLSFITLLIYLLIYSDVYHKYLLVSMAVSQIALYLAGSAVDERETEYA